MPDETAADISQRVNAACELMPDAAGTAKLEHHLDWELAELMERLGPDDLTPHEKMAMCAILAPAHSRKRAKQLALTGELPGRGRLLRLVPPVTPVHVPVSEGWPGSFPVERADSLI